MEWLTGSLLVVIVLRLLVPLLILRWPLLGGVLALLLDTLDVVILDPFGGMGPHYHQLDKVLDLYYLSLEAWVAWHWTDRVPRLVAVGLFGWRLLGVVLFELTGVRWLLLVFANLFELWFLFVLLVRSRLPRVPLARWRVATAWLVVLSLPKLGQEYLLHVAEAPTWTWIKNWLGL